MGAALLASAVGAVCNGRMHWRESSLHQLPLSHEQKVAETARKQISETREGTDGAVGTERRSGAPGPPRSAWPRPPGRRPLASLRAPGTRRQKGGGGRGSGGCARVRLGPCRGLRSSQRGGLFPYLAQQYFCECPAPVLRPVMLAQGPYPANTRVVCARWPGTGLAPGVIPLCSNAAGFVGGLGGHTLQVERTAQGAGSCY